MGANWHTRDELCMNGSDGDVVFWFNVLIIARTKRRSLGRRVRSQWRKETARVCCVDKKNDNGKSQRRAEYAYLLSEGESELVDMCLLRKIKISTHFCLYIHTCELEYTKCKQIKQKKKYKMISNCTT